MGWKTGSHGPGVRATQYSEVNMNSKKAKALRRDARTYGASAPEVASVTLRNGQNINAPFSQRGLYRRLKQGTKGQLPHGKDV